MRHNLRQICWWLTTVVVQHSNFEVVKIAEVFSDDVTKIVIFASSRITFSSCALLFNDVLKGNGVILSGFEVTCRLAINMALSHARLESSRRKEAEKFIRTSSVI